jgi:SAM-dependent methyltransferase
MHSAAAGRRPDRAAALEQYRWRAPHYDFEVALFEPVRLQAIDSLELHAGATVIDVGCGTGLSFEPLARRIGPRGRIVAIEQSPEMIEQARERVARQHLQHVRLVCEPAATAALPARADAALFHLVHDILRDELALANVLSHLKPGARVVASGLRWAPPWFWPGNAFVMAAALYSTTTSLEGLGEPWDKLAAHLRHVQVRTTWFGAMFVASGVYAPPVH